MQCNKVSQFVKFGMINVCMVTVQKCWSQMPVISEVKVFSHGFLKDP